MGEYFLRKSSPKSGPRPYRNRNKIFRASVALYEHIEVSRDGSTSLRESPSCRISPLSSSLRSELFSNSILVDSEDKNEHRLVAIKVIDADAADYTEGQIDDRDQSFRDFRHEVAVLGALKQLQARNINTIIDVFPLYDSLWIVTEFCAGGSVHTLVRLNLDFSTPSGVHRSN